MCVFEKRKITAPAELAFGEEGHEDPSVPPNAALQFEVELIEVTESKGGLFGMGG